MIQKKYYIKKVIRQKLIKIMNQESKNRGDENATNA